MSSETALCPVCEDLWNADPCDVVDATWIENQRPENWCLVHQEDRETCDCDRIWVAGQVTVAFVVIGVLTVIGAVVAAFVGL